MNCTHLTVAAAALGLLAADAVGQSWAGFTNETSTRLDASSDLGSNDTQEKDYAWSDFDKDGDVDLVVVRKLPFSTPIGRRNVLFMNEGIADGQLMNGVLVDRTTTYMTASSDGSNGFLDITNDRDVIVVDVDLDGWDDVVTSTAYGQGQSKTISHSRIYMNLGDSPPGSGNWQGFQYQEPRIPQLIEAPNTCAVAAGDVTGNGYPDLYYVSYNSTVLEDHLLVNDGTGHFTDQSNLRMSSAMLTSIFGTGGAIEDMNGDGWKDVIKSEAGFVKTFYNAGNGFFGTLDNTSSGAHYFMSVDDLNDDGLMDIIISDDGADRYRLNEGNGGIGLATFANSTFSFTGGGFDDGFAGNSLAADLNNDGFKDVIITDVDVDVPGCIRRTHIYRNLGNLPNVTLQEQMVSGQVVGIPTSQLTGTHDIAAFDIDGDSWNDLVIGRCASTEVWINQPPVGAQFTYPAGLPAFVPPNQDTDVDLQLITFGGAASVPGTAKLNVSVDGAPFQSLAMTDLGDDAYRGTLPASECTAQLDFYFEVELDSLGVVTDPAGAPATTYVAIAALGTIELVRDEIEEEVTDWLTVDDGSPGDIGLWEQADPNGTVFNGFVAQPEDDATQAHEATQCFVTANGPFDGDAGGFDVDGGPFRLISPVLDLDGTDGTVSYARWFFTGAGVPDVMTVDITPDGGSTWVPIPEHTTGDTNQLWQQVSFVVSDYITPTADVRVRFTASDAPNDSVTEAGIDNFIVDVFDCGQPDCPGNANGDGAVDGQDVVAVILAWGTTDPGADVNDDGVVDGSDLVQVILGWGPCP